MLNHPTDTAQMPMWREQRRAL